MFIWPLGYFIIRRGKCNYEGNGPKQNVRGRLIYTHLERVSLCYLYTFHWDLRGGFALGSSLGSLYWIRLAAPVLGLTECLVQYAKYSLFAK